MEPAEFAQRATKPVGNSAVVDQAHVPGSPRRSWISRLRSYVVPRLQQRKERTAQSPCLEHSESSSACTSSDISSSLPSPRFPVLVSNGDFCPPLCGETTPQLLPENPAEACAAATASLPATSLFVVMSPADTSNVDLVETATMPVETVTLLADGDVNECAVDADQSSHRQHRLQVGYDPDPAEVNCNQAAATKASSPTPPLRCTESGGALSPVSDCTVFSTSRPQQFDGARSSSRVTPRMRPNNVRRDNVAARRWPLLGGQLPHHKDKHLLVLDLDETLVTSTYYPIANPDVALNVNIRGTLSTVFVLVRPGCMEFLRRMAEVYEVIVFTASQQQYADPLLDILDPMPVQPLPPVRRQVSVVVATDRDSRDLSLGEGSATAIWTSDASRGGRQRVEAEYASTPEVSLHPSHHPAISARLFRESCISDLRTKQLAKDLSMLGRGPHNTILMDNSAFSFSIQPENGLLCSSFTGDPADNELKHIGTFLESVSTVPDVREPLRWWHKRASRAASMDLRAARSLAPATTAAIATGFDSTVVPISHRSVGQQSSHRSVDQLSTHRNADTASTVHHPEEDLVVYTDGASFGVLPTPNLGRTLTLGGDLEDAVLPSALPRRASSAGRGRFRMAASQGRQQPLKRLVNGELLGITSWDYTSLAESKSSADTDSITRLSIYRSVEEEVAAAASANTTNNNDAMPLKLRALSNAAAAVAQAVDALPMPYLRVNTSGTSRSSSGVVAAAAAAVAAQSAPRGSLPTSSHLRDAAPPPRGDTDASLRAAGAALSRSSATCTLQWSPSSHPKLYQPPCHLAVPVSMATDLADASALSVPLRTADRFSGLHSHRAATSTVLAACSSPSPGTATYAGDVNSPLHARSSPSPGTAVKSPLHAPDGTKLHLHDTPSPRYDRVGVCLPPPSDTRHHRMEEVHRTPSDLRVVTGLPIVPQFEQVVGSGTTSTRVAAATSTVSPRQPVYTFVRSPSRVLLVSVGPTPLVQQIAAAQPATSMAALNMGSHESVSVTLHPSV